MQSSRWRFERKNFGCITTT
nr:unnamed protein product [Callosobruchus analis]